MRWVLDTEYQNQDLNSIYIEYFDFFFFPLQVFVGFLVFVVFFFFETGTNYIIH